MSDNTGEQWRDGMALDPTEEIAALRERIQTLAAERDAAIRDASDAEERLRAGPDTKPHALRPVVWAFAHAMEAKLSLHDEERGPRGWMGDKERGFARASPLYLASRIYEKLLELRGAVAHGSPPVDVLCKASDVANMAMMVADVCDAVLAPALSSVSTPRGTP